MNVDSQAAPEKIRRLQMVELDLLLAVDRLCTKHHLTYYLVGGSALGAARHHGFIPWDDDIDVGMPRPEYQRFLQVCSNELPAGLFLQTRQTDPSFFRHFAVIMNENTAWLEPGYQRVRYHQGVGIDIWPIDGAPSSPILQRMHAAVIWLSVVSGSLRYVARYSGRFFKRILALMSLCIPYDFWFGLGEKALRWSKLETAPYWGHICAGDYMRQVVPRECFGRPERLKFEDHDLPVPGQLDAYLKHLYGNYLQQPPMEQRAGHSAYLIDLEKSYLNYPPWTS
jgi:lipopolysaccharide cholinephosphotransferase